MAVFTTKRVSQGSALTRHKIEASDDKSFFIGQEPTSSRVRELFVSKTGSRTSPATSWIITDELEGWKFQIDVIAGGLRISASAPGGSVPAVWVVTS